MTSTRGNSCASVDGWHSAGCICDVAPAAIPPNVARARDRRDRLHRGRLIPVLEAACVELHCLALHRAGLLSRVAPMTVVVQGDVLDPASLDQALEGIDVAYCLVHSGGPSPRMIGPRWVSTLLQPIGIDDVLAYLCARTNGDSGRAVGFSGQAPRPAGGNRPGDSRRRPRVPADTVVRAPRRRHG